MAPADGLNADDIKKLIVTLSAATKPEPLPANGWRTSKWIMKAYGISKTSLYRLKQGMLTQGYEKGIWQINKQTSYINERVFQKFLASMSNNFLEKEYGI